MGAMFVVVMFHCPMATAVATAQYGALQGMVIPLLLLPVGALYFALYYFLFRFVIVKFDLRTPGRDPTESAPVTGERKRIDHESP